MYFPLSIFRKKKTEERKGNGVDMCSNRKKKLDKKK